MRLLLSLFAFAAIGVIASKAAQADQVGIGLIGTYSGPNAAAGKQVSRAVSDTVVEINKRGGVLGKRLVVFPRDSGGNPLKARENADYLVNVEKVQFVLMHCNADCAIKASTALEEYKVPHAVVLIDSDSAEAEAIALLKAWIERVKAAGKFDLSNRSRKQRTMAARSSAVSASTTNMTTAEA